MKRIVVIDYGLSNLLSVKNAFAHLGVEVIISQRQEDIYESEVLVLPGVGAFEDGMTKMSKLNLIEALTCKAKEGTPLLGICLGMQMLFDESEEFGIHKGLGFIPGRIVRIPSTAIDGTKQKVPHISWNPLYPAGGRSDFSESILDEINQGEECYFIHSYEAKPAFVDYCLAETEYGGRRICAVAQNKDIIGMQFHPEKSGEVGLRILKRFLDIYC